MVPASKPQSFTITAPGRLRSITTGALVCPAFDPTTVSDPATIPYVAFTAIWDTGATNTVITQKVVDACGLKPISLAEVHTASGKMTCEVYLIGMAIPNGLAFASIRVTRGILSEGVDVLIGMDIISGGDFAITNKDHKTTFSFSYPSTRQIRFHSPPDIPVGRNEPCPCGSGAKYKNCCGA